MKKMHGDSVRVPPTKYDRVPLSLAARTFATPESHLVQARLAAAAFMKDQTQQVAKIRELSDLPQQSAAASAASAFNLAAAATLGLGGVRADLPVTSSFGTVTIEEIPTKTDSSAPDSSNPR